mmetsp:Transcript_65238/g.211248  ORF Transcript_65238/g.211248 Transcript_65238/m.211248 type:complete len:1145 (-) Transcript_65238:110-3544(-)
MAQIQTLMDMGFSEGDARRALQQVNGNVEQAIERLLSGAVGGEPEFPALRAEGSSPQFGTGANGPDGVIQVANAPLPPVDSFPSGLEVETLTAVPADARKDGLPCGLRNVGNTCYVNSLLQTFLHIDEFRDQMLRYRTPTEMPDAGERSAAGAAVAEPETEDAPDKESEKRARRLHGISLASELRQLFAFGLFTNRSCVDPSLLLAQLVDRRGQKLPIGSQEDVGEFMLMLLEQLEEGIRSGDFIPALQDTKPTVGAASSGVAEATDDQSGVGKAIGSAAPTAEEPAAVDVASEAPVAAAKAADEAGAPADEVADKLPDAGKADTAAEPVKAVAEETSEEGLADKKRLSILQSLFFGEQVQVFSYRHTPDDSVEAANVASGEGAQADSQPKAEGGDAEVPSGSEAPPTGSAGAAAAAPGSPKKEGPPTGSSGAAALAPKEKAKEPVPDANGMIVNEEKSDFLHIFLDVKSKSLYRAWEAARHTEVDYTTPSGSSTTACTSTWIKRLPKLLFFQLQRVMFDQETKAQVKLDDPFEFEMKIYVDRFLLANRTRATEAASNVGKLQDEKDKLEEALLGFGNFKGRSNLGVSDVLAWAAECLETNARAEASEGLPEPSSVAAQSGAAGTEKLLADLKQGAPSAVTLLRSLSDVCGAQVARLKGDVERLGNEIDEAYSDLRKEAYELYAIWVHSGIAGSGHYWAFIRDWQQDRWYRLDDARVTVVPWDEVHESAVGREGSHTSAYVLVYVQAGVAAEQRKARDHQEVSRVAETLVPSNLMLGILQDNIKFQEEQKQQEVLKAEQDLRRHAEAIFQHYAGLIHQWEPQKRIHDSTGNPHDANGRKFLHDAALLGFELFLYRLHGEQDVWTYLVAKSFEAQKAIRAWRDEDEGRILFFLSGTLRSQQAYASMLRETTSADGVKRCELIPLDAAKLATQYNTVLLQGQIVDEALQALKDDPGVLVKTVSMLAFVWARWNLENEDKFRQNEVLLIMSTLIYNTVNVLERAKRTAPERVSLAVFETACEYFLLLLHAVEWPKGWKTPLIARLQVLFPQATVAVLNRLGASMTLDVTAAQIVELREAVLQHPLTQEQARLDLFEASRSEPGQAFFERHRTLYSWVMHGDEMIAQDYVLNIVPELPGVAGFANVGT